MSLLSNIRSQRRAYDALTPTPAMFSEAAQFEMVAGSGKVTPALSPGSCGVALGIRVLGLT